MRATFKIGALALLLASTGIAFAAEPDAEVNGFVCELTGDCDAPAAVANAPTAAAPSGARTSSTRGFTFARSRAAGETARIAPANGQAMASAAPASAPRAAAPAQPGAANLKLDFASGSATLTEGAKARLAKLATALETPKLASHRLRIEGHTDAVGSATSNRALSQRRAQSTADYLVSAGVDASRLEVVGLGSSRPLPGVPATSATNRRVMAVVLN
ncbi:OmpA family protein [Sphingomonas sp. 1P06PA]|uniref:OmpA family protein n=1 Tax=Sphingomonas sp. 1P06PA TaxID=554121 RepID=UPI0039A65B36